jgi:uncharacterized protein (TIGR00255 family)
MTVSMTGFATRRGQGAGATWTWDVRSVNGKGLDLRLRVPDWIEGLEPALRPELAKALSRGNVSLSLKVDREAAAAPLRLNPAALAAAIAALAEAESAAMAAGVTLAPATGADLIALRGVLEAGPGEEETGGLRAAILADLPALLSDLHAARAAEGASLARIVAEQLDRIEALVAEARTEAAARRETVARALGEAVARILADGVDEARVAQELALLAVKQDVTEEIDRLTAHVAAARALLSGPGPVGRKFDFLTQEFMREANTLCSKAQAAGLTRVGLDLKVVVDQMREQAANIE